MDSGQCCAKPTAIALRVEEMIGNARLAECVAEAYGPANPRAPKISPLQAQVIAGAYERGAQQKMLAKTYGVAQSTISRTITNHLKAPSHVGAFSMTKEK